MNAYDKTIEIIASTLNAQGIDNPELAHTIASDLDYKRMIIPTVDFNDRRNHDKAVQIASQAIFSSELKTEAALNVVNDLSLAGLITPDEY